jgi:hypothetical protein
MKCSRCSKSIALRSSGNPACTTKEVAHDPHAPTGSQPIDIPEVIPNPAVVPKQEPTPKEPAPKGPVKVPERVAKIA